ncbi:hypothetical protein PB2503_03137 [Parvularcula bermudensis HTCC2503]|uniref:NAD(P)-binding domain-containing protein n=1 Tax=Parvularcula bermudensis (strain ATCC BAA-594 / HTCC2503 / KCTC 12087) TaxID=314260 RepID=E0TD45_PARBH|nr:NAD(P)H-binding protein [Parvularcula bermudensis]ADM08704.1 hypothetical protein PB2503_03137 [Parvularcula bermudensis HTCC2503]
MTTITVFGAAGATGTQVVKEAVTRGYTVRAVERAWPARAPSLTGVTTFTADVLSDPLDPAIDGSDAIISCLGLAFSPQTAIAPPPLYTEGTLRIIEAMRQREQRRLVVISAAFVDPHTEMPTWFRHSAYRALRPIFSQMADMERVLRASEGIDWCAVRPGWLLNEPATGDFRVFDKALPKGVFRTRHADLAAFLIDNALNDRWLRSTPAIGRKESVRFTTPPALLKEVLKL